MCEDSDSPQVAVALCRCEGVPRVGETEQCWARVVDAADGVDHLGLLVEKGPKTEVNEAHGFRDRIPEDIVKFEVAASRTRYKLGQGY